jgi:hypothetical protein
MKWNEISANILHDINICFIALVHVNYLVFLRRLKHGGPWLGELSLPAWRCHLLFRHLWLRKESGARRAPHSTSVRGHRRGSAKAMADWVLLDIEVGASNELPLMIRQSFKDG